MKKLGLIVMIVAAFAAFAVPATAVAATNGYNDVSGVTGSSGGPTSSAGTPEAVASSGSSDLGVLPFTGLELSIMLGVGIVLLGTGLVLRRVRTTD